MSLAGCSNLNAWVRALDKRVEGVLARRLEKVGRVLGGLLFVGNNVCLLYQGLIDCFAERLFH